MAKKNEVTDEVIDFCIANKMTLEEGMIAMIDAKLEKAEHDLIIFKKDVTNTMNELNSKVTRHEMDDVESFISSLNQQIQD